MKKFFCIATTMILAACGTQQTESSTATIKGPVLPAPITVNKIIFERNDLPVDGALVRLTLEKDERNLYEASVYTAAYNRMLAELIENTEVIATGLACSGAHVIECSRDDRPVDGALKVVRIMTERNGSRAQLITSIWDRINAELNTETTLIADRMIQRSDLAEQTPHWGSTGTVKFVSDMRRVDGPLREVILTLRANGRYDATLRVIPGGRAAGPNPTATLEDLAWNLECENQYADEIGTITSISCEHDGRPVDGPLVQLFASIDGDSYDLSLGKTPARRPGQEPDVRDLGFGYTLVIPN